MGWRPGLPNHTNSMLEEPFHMIARVLGANGGGGLACREALSNSRAFFFYKGLTLARKQRRPAGCAGGPTGKSVRWPGTRKQGDICPGRTGRRICARAVLLRAGNGQVSAKGGCQWGLVLHGVRIYPPLAPSTCTRERPVAHSLLGAATRSMSLFLVIGFCRAC